MGEAVPKKVRSLTEAGMGNVSWKDGGVRSFIFFTYQSSTISKVKRYNKRIKHKN